MEIITVQLRRRVFKRDNYTCAYCLEKYPVEDLHIDHIHPKSKGGTNLPSNLITACQGCNVEKNARILKNPPIPKEMDLITGDLRKSNRTDLPLYGVRLSKETKKRLDEAKEVSGYKSLNIFMTKLLDLYENNKKRI